MELKFDQHINKLGGETTSIKKPARKKQPRRRIYTRKVRGKTSERISIHYPLFFVTVFMQLPLRSPFLRTKKATWPISLSGTTIVFHSHPSTAFLNTIEPRNLVQGGHY